VSNLNWNRPELQRRNRYSQKISDDRDEKLETITRQKEKSSNEKKQKEISLLKKVQQLCGKPFEPNLWQKKDKVRLYFMDGSYLKVTSNGKLFYDTSDLDDERRVKFNIKQMIDFLKEHFPTTEE
tara:strand:+ start:881 stop:1255 length:375 start_codon:yes stop_codon:yes gene_type:complete